MISENASIELHKLLQFLGKLLKQKGNIKSSINAAESDIIEYNALQTDIGVHHNNSDILSNRNRVLQKKQEIINYLDQSLAQSNQGYNKILDLLWKKSMGTLEFSQFPSSSGERLFNSDIDDLNSELEKSKDLERYLKEEIMKRQGLEEELESNLRREDHLDDDKEQKIN